MSDNPDEPVGGPPPPAPYQSAKREMFAITLDATSTDLTQTWDEMFARQIGMCVESYRAAYRDRFGRWPDSVMVRISCDVEAMPEGSGG